jgi:hypothetical protein
MKTPLIIVLVIVVGIIGFLTVYSQQHDMAVASQGHGGAGGYGGASGGYGGAPSGGGYGK